MPLLAGEVSLLTIFADVHYYFSHPSAKPPHHRFDKTSYVYLFQSSTQNRGRVEVANHPGTPDQDAFNGYLDSVRVERSHKHPLLFTITVDGAGAQNGSHPSTPSQDMSQWHLPAFDPKNDTKYMYKIHTVDIYFWTESDATLFLDSLKRVLQAGQLRILDAPPAPIEHRDSTMSPVVQKLEQAAISKSYNRTESIGSIHAFPGPPKAVSPENNAGHPPAGELKPMAYNPAAPAAPEPIAHREKTPPPPDAESGTGLTAAAVHDHAGHIPGPPQGGFAPQSTGGQPYMPGPPQRQGSFPPPPPGAAGTPPGIQRTNTGSSFPPPPPPPNGGTPQPGIQRQPTINQYSQQPSAQYANYPGSPGHPPVQSPGFPPAPPMPQSPGYPPVQSPGHPPYSQYSYGAQQQQAADPYSTHAQVYRPTEAEAHSHVKPANPNPSGQPPSQFAQRAEKLEKGVGRFLKKLDKKF